MTRLVITHRSFDGSFSSPPIANSPRDSGLLQVKLSTPRRDVLRSSSIREKYISAGIGHLVKSCYPMTVARLIVSVVVASVNFMLGSWRVSHVLQKIHKAAASNPSSAYRYAAIMVISSVVFSLVLTSLAHCSPDFIDSCLRHSVTRVSLRRYVTPVAPTGRCMPGRNLFERKRLLYTTLAVAQNYPTLSAVTSDERRKFFDNSELAKRRSRWHNQFTHDATPISRLRETLSSYQLPGVSSFYGKADWSSI